MQHSIGEIIRQVRRQRNLTQTELGGERYSKSYVSAVERNKIISSHDALRFFAEQLGQHDSYFIELLGDSDTDALATTEDSRNEGLQQFSQAQNEAMNLLDMLLENTDLSQLSINRSIPVLSPDLVEALPRQKQFRFYFLMGLSARKHGDLISALKAFEYALAIAPVEQQPVILDELGSHYAAENGQQTALMYFKRALNLLQDDTCGVHDTRDVLKFKVELHCAESYQALGVYEDAITFYERARQHLQSDHGLRTAALLYLGLGYCTCADILQRAARALSSDTSAPVVTQEDIEVAYRSGVSYLIQSRSVFQVTDDLIGETQVRMALTFILLDFCEQRLKSAGAAREDGKALSDKKCMTLLEDAEDQCRQVLLGWQKKHGEKREERENGPATEQTDVVAIACAGLIRVAVQRAWLAHDENFKETTTREMSVALYLCEQLLNIFKNPEQLWRLVSNMTSIANQTARQRITSIPREIAIAHVEEHNPLPLTEVYLALGETAEALGRISTTQSFSTECFAQSTRWFETALSSAQRAVKEHKIDLGYLPRCFQQCIALLEARVRSSSSFSEESSISLLTFLRNGLALMPIITS